MIRHFGFTFSLAIFLASATNQTCVAAPALKDFLIVGENAIGSDYYSIAIPGIVIALLLGWLLLRVGGTRGGIDDGYPGRSPKVVGWTLLGITNTLLMLGIAYFYNNNATLKEENLRLRSAQNSGGGTSNGVSIPPPVVVNAQSLPVPPYPMHPKRLGGTYYRGNDERDESLFNGGFYRTATIELGLVDSNGKRLQWGDQIGNEQFVEIQIRRAPKTSRELFSKRVLDSLSIEHYCQTDTSVEETLRFDVIEEGELWQARIAIPTRQQWVEDHMQGMIYLMYGVQPGNEKLPRPHFGIKYDLHADEQAIAQTSQLWMGSLYTLGGRVMVPQDKQVLLDRWFDWRPIPVIEGEPSTDPELLGLPEHLD